MPKRPLLRTALAAALLACIAAAPRQAAGQDRPAGFPQQPIRLVNPSPPGGNSDVVARYFAAQLAPRLGQPVVVDPRPGASGQIALDYVARQPADGSVLVYGVAGFVSSNIALRARLPFDMLRDFRPVARFAISPQCLFVRAGISATDANGLVDLARRQPGGLTYASFGIGTTSHLQMEMLKQLTGTDLLHVPFRGSADGAQAVATGRVDVFVIDMVPMQPFLESGQVRCIAMTGQRRWPSLPDVPTLREQGFALDLVGWHAIFAPAATPDATVRFLSAEIRRIATSPEGQAVLLRNALFPWDEDPEETARFHRADIDRWRAAVRAAGIQPE